MPKVRHGVVSRPAGFSLGKRKLDVRFYVVGGAECGFSALDPLSGLSCPSATDPIAEFVLPMILARMSPFLPIEKSRSLMTLTASVGP